MRYSVVDIETDGLNATKIHCLCYKTYDTELETTKLGSITDYSEMISFLVEQEIIVGHNIIRFDIPQLEKILGIKILARLVDTLAFSWYLYPEKSEHGLESWGEFFGVPKPVVNDWQNLSIEEYLHRCQEDVRINDLLFDKQIEYLKKIYSNSSEDINRIMDYLSFKMDCAREQEEVKWKLDVPKVQSNLEMLKEEKVKRIDLLTEAMPLVIKYKIVNKPAHLYKKDGSLSVIGERWFNALEELGLPQDYEDSIKLEVTREPGNPGSFSQMKEWLFSLGWEPITFKYKKDKETEEIQKIPQISLIDGSGICPSITRLYEQYPALENLEGLFVIKHRIGILEGFLRDVDNEGYLKAEIAGFTNTLRFRHKTIVNLPAIYKKFGCVARECLISPEGYTLCGADMSSLEDNTKRHYMFNYDPEYVKEQMTPGFDAHLDIAKLAGLLTPEEVEEHKLFDKTKGKEGKNHSKVRKDAKQVNFASVYGAGPPKIALTSGMPLEKAKELHITYWKRNWSVKSIAKDTKHKTVNGQMWLYNPVSRFWYSLRFEKDKFSTLNQGTGVYCFDTWVKYVRKGGALVCGQFHDEIIAPVKLGDEEKTEEILKEAIDETNEELNLNVKLGVSIQFGTNYSLIH